MTQEYSPVTVGNYFVVRRRNLETGNVSHRVYHRNSGEPISAHVTKSDALIAAANYNMRDKEHDKAPEAPPRTTGPWSFHAADWQPWPGAVSITGQRGNLVAFTTSTDGKTHTADARLIAAAPDLLDALKMILQYDEAYGIDFKEWERDQLYAAIQKAEGSK